MIMNTTFGPCSWAMLLLSRRKIHRGDSYGRRIGKNCDVVPASRWISCAIRVINKLVSCRGHLLTFLSYVLRCLQRHLFPGYWCSNRGTSSWVSVPSSRRDAAYQVLALRRDLPGPVYSVARLLMPAAVTPCPAVCVFFFAGGWHLCARSRASGQNSSSVVVLLLVCCPPSPFETAHELAELSC